MPHVLYVVHSLPPEEHTGTPLVTLGYARALSARGWTVTVVSGTDPTEASWMAPQVVQEPGEAFLRIRVPLSALPGGRWAVEAASVRGVGTPAAAGFARILRRRRPDVVHVVDNVHLPLELPEVAKAAGIPVVRSVSCAEDLCGLVAPVSPCSGPSGYCAPPLTPEHCAACIRAARPDLLGLAGDGSEGIDGPAAAEDAAWWQRWVLAALVRKRARAVHQYTKVFDRIVFSNGAWRRYFEATLPLDPARAHTIPMGMDLESWGGRSGGGPRSAQPCRSAAPPGPGEPVVFGLAGMLHAIKAADAVLAAFTSPELLARDDYRLRCLGGGDPRVLGALGASNPRVEVLGGYRPEELPGLLAGLHVGLAPSYFETFHRVTREYLLAGLPVIASRAFGILDAVRHGVNGLVFDHAEPGAFVRAVTAVLDDRQLLARLRAGAAATTIRSLDEELDDLTALYADVLAAREPSP